MLVIVGHKITMQQGEDCSFRVIVKNLKGDIVPLSESDIITMRIRRRRKPGIILTKITSPVYIKKEDGSAELAHIFEFNSADTAEMSYGDYIYDVTLESDNNRYTIIPKAVFSLSMSIELADSGEYYDDVIDVDYNGKSEEGVMSPTPLVGIFSYVEFNRTYTSPYEDTIILY